LIQGQEERCVSSNDYISDYYSPVVVYSPPPLLPPQSVVSKSRLPRNGGPCRTVSAATRPALPFRNTLDRLASRPAYWTEVGWGLGYRTENR
jgi:hypothetical protein